MFQAIGLRTGLAQLRAGQLATRRPIVSPLATTISAASATYLVTVRLIALSSKMILQSLRQSQSPLLTLAQSQALNLVQSQAQSRAQSLVLIMRNYRRLLQKSSTA